MLAQHGWLEISAGRLRANAQRLAAALPAAGALCATVKANAYGHGTRAIAPLLAGCGIGWACVYSVEEARELCSICPELKVLVLAPARVTGNAGALAAPAAEPLPPGVRLTVADIPSADWLNHMAAARQQPLPVHVQVDTGLTRAGVAPADCDALLTAVQRLPHLRLEGLYMHLSHGEARGHPSTAAQLAAFAAVAYPWKQRLGDLLLHAQNSGGVFTLPEARFDLARVGIALYGLQPSTEHPVPGLLPVAELKARILHIHDAAAGVGVGYGHAFTTRRPTRVAVVPVGYADGYPRALSGTGRAVVQVAGRPAPVIGRVSMDQITVDVTDIPAAVGDTVTVISNQAAAPNSVDAVARQCGTIGYEIATGFSARLARTVIV